jgi:hypothetical protein
MIIHLRAISAISALILLSACAATSANVKPKTAADGQNPDCVTQTASRIAAMNADHSGACSAPGRSYSKTDIDRTGATTAGDALRLLDPSITVRQ